MDIIDHYKEFDQHIIGSYPDLGLYDLHTFEKDGVDLCSPFASTARRKVQRKPFHDFKFFDNLAYISKDLRYCTAMLYFLRPYINHTIKEDGTYFKTPTDTRYMMYANMAFQLVYNYYDKIGDVLDSFFDTGLNHNVYFSRVINNFPNEHKVHPEFVWLSNLQDQEFKPLNIIRDNIVHSTHLEAEIFYKVMDAKFDMTKLNEIQKEKESYPELFKKQLEIAIEAFEKTITLIGRLPDKPDYGKVI